MNCFIVMLSLSLAFYFSKSLRCCQQLTTHLACETAALSGDMRIDCMGYETCMDLKAADTWRVLPEELTQQPFVCDAFPRSTLLGRITVILVIAAVLTPVQL
jgi:hypothetical protein